MSAIALFRAGLGLSLALAVAGCGINNVPTLEERAKAAWSEVQNQYQRRADLIPNLVETVKGYAAAGARGADPGHRGAGARRARSRSTPRRSPIPQKFQEFQEAQNQLSGALGPAARHGRALSRAEVERQFPRPAIAARGHREPHRGGAARLHRDGAALQHRAAHHSRGAGSPRSSIRTRSRWRRLPRRRGRPAAAGEVLTPSAGRARSHRCAPSSASASRRGSRAAIRLILGARLLRSLFRHRQLALPQPAFPALTGRVVDAANILKPEDAGRARSESSRRMRTRPRDQVVVATVPSPRRHPVEDYANRLFRIWELGQKAKNNGVLLARRAERAQGAHRGRLRARRRADRCPVEGHHRHRDRAEIQDRAILPAASRRGWTRSCRS